jgi:NAD+ diphosphatase
LEDKANKVNMEQANALAPADKIPGEGQSDVGQTKGLTRVPPKTAIAGQLVALWAAGGLKVE